MAVFVWIKLSPGPRFRFALNDPHSDGREWAAVRMGDAIRDAAVPESLWPATPCAGVSRGQRSWAESWD